jgi:hypothetical protein
MEVLVPSDRIGIAHIAIVSKKIGGRFRRLEQLINESTNILSNALQAQGVYVE